MKYRNRTSGHIYNSIFEIQQQFPNVSFPMNWTEETYDFANVDLVAEVAEPPVTSVYNKMEYAGIQQVNGQWTEVWNEVPKYSDPTEQAEWIDSCTLSQWYTVREQRDALLKATDYTQLPDTPITQNCRSSFVTYRQALRDITVQSDPYNIVWPIMPIYEK